MEDTYLTLAEAVTQLDPPISVADLERLVEANGLRPHGTRRKLGPGRPARTYSWTALSLIHAANIPLRIRFACPSGVS